jgi:uncharacterized protein (DUF2141 family)
MIALAPATGATTEVDVRVLGVASDAGVVRAAVCAQAEFLRPTCRYVGHAPARRGVTTVRVSDVPPGVYAVQAHHDANNDGKVNRNLFGIPTEGIGFSRAAPMRFGPPRFADAAVSIGGALVRLDITLKFEP